MFVTEAGAIMMKKSVTEWTALLVGVVMLLDHIPSEWKYQCPENNQMDL